MTTSEPMPDPLEPEPSEATGGAVDVVPSRDHELAVAQEQIARALFPRREAAELKIGRFVVERRLGAGAMGVVYAAHDPALDRRVAIKLVRPDVAGDRKAQLRLEREARALAKVSHPNIVAIHEVGEHRGQVFLAMEHVQGQSLRAWQEAKPRSPSEVLAMYVQAGRGLAAAHAAGLVHRDFKPDNVLVDETGRARVVDFGLVSGDEAARRAELTRWRRSEGESVALTTHTHALVGTPAYMSPEQLQGGAADARSDQFAFCVALWEALYGERPFHGSSLAQLAARVIEGELRSPTTGRRVPGWVRRACLRGLSVDPRRRWPSLDALIALLAKDRTRALVQSSVAWFVAALLLVGVVVPMGWGAFTAVMVFSEPVARVAARDARDAAQHQVEAQVAAFDASDELGARASSWARTPGRELEALALAVKAVGAAEGKPVSAKAIRGLLDALAQTRRSIALDGDDGGVARLGWTADGARLATAGRVGTVRLRDGDTGQVLATIDVHAPELEGLGWTREGGVSVQSPEGTYAAAGHEDGTVTLRRTTIDAAPIVLSGHARPISAMAWSPDGKRLATASEDGTVRLWDGETGASAAILVGHTHAVRALAWTLDGTRLATGSDDGATRVWDGRSGAELATLSGHADAVRMLSWRPDGMRLATASADGEARLWVDLEASEVSRMLDGPTADPETLARSTADLPRLVARACTILEADERHLDAEAREICMGGRDEGSGTVASPALR